jgi:predicted component of type VI protein secretion system
VNYPALPRSGLLAPRLLRTGSSENRRFSGSRESSILERLPVSASKLAPDVGTALTNRSAIRSHTRTRNVLGTVPDSAGDFPSRVVRSVPLLPNGHSATTDSARFLSSFERRIASFVMTKRLRRFEPRLNTVGDVVSLVLPSSTGRVVNVADTVQTTRAGAVSPPCSRLPFGRCSLRKGA